MDEPRGTYQSCHKESLLFHQISTAELLQLQKSLLPRYMEEGKPVEFALFKLDSIFPTTRGFSDENISV